MAITPGAVGALAASATASITPAHPSGLATGDTLVAHLYSRSGNTPTPPAGLGWTQIQTGLNVGRSSVWRRTFTAGDTAGAWTGGGTTGFYGVISAFRGVDLTTPIDVAAPAAATGTTNPATAPSITTVTADAVAVSFFVNADNGAGVGFAGPTNGFSIGYGGGAYTSTAGSDGAVGQTLKTINAPGATGSNALTADDDNGFATLAWVAITIALRPAADTQGAVTRTSTATATVTAQRSDTAAVAAARSAAATVTAARTDAAQVTATRTAAATATAVRSDTGQVTATRTAAATVTAASSTANLTASSGPQHTVTATVSSPAQVLATRTAVATATAVRSDAAQVTATRTAVATVTPVQPTAAVTATRTATAVVTGLRTDTAAVTATRTSLRTVTGLRTDIAAVAAASGSSAAVAAGAISALGATGAPLNPQAFLVDRTTLAVTAPLPAWTKLTLSPQDASPGSCVLDYPAGAPGFDALFANVSATPQRDQEIEVWLDGTAASATRWLLQQKTGDDVALGQVWSFTGHGLAQLLDEIMVGPQDTDTAELVFAGATYGQILIGALTQAQARSAAVLAGVTWDFTAAVDSAGQPWAQSISEIRFAPDATLLDVAQAGAGFTLGEFALTPGRVLQAWNPGTRGVDRSLGGTPVRLQAGTNLSEAARRESSRVGDAATAALGKGAEGIYQWAIDPTAEGERGRRVEVAVDAGQLGTAGAVLATTASRLTGLVEGVSERTHGLAMGPGLPIPLVDFDVADWVLSVTGNVATRQRITQWTLTFARTPSGLDTSGSARTNTLIEDQLSRLDRRLNAVQRGGAVVGTSTPSPDVDDGIAPGQVQAVTLDTDAYRQQGTTVAVVEIGWATLTVNADALPITDLDRYEPEYSYNEPGLPFGWVALPAIPAGTTATQVDGLVAGAQVLVRVRAVDRWGRAGAYSTIAAIVTDVDDEPPPVPSAPAPFARAGIILIPWDGQGAAGEPQPDDYLRTEVHRSSAAVFTPDRPLIDGVLDEAASSTYRGDMRAAMTIADEIPLASYGQTFYYRLVSVDRSHNASDPSAVGSVLARPAQDGELAGISAGKILVGIIDAVVGIGQRLYAGNPAGAGWEGDPAGFRFYSMISGTRQTVLEFVAATASLVLTGTFQSGKTGRRIVVNGGTSQIRFMPQTGETRFGAVTSFIPSNLPNDIAVQLEASDSDTVSESAYVQALPDKALLIVSPPLQQNRAYGEVQVGRDSVAAQIMDGTAARVREGGYLLLRRGGVAGSFFGHINNGESFIGLNDNGDVVFTSASGQVRSTSAMGSGGAGFSFKVQGLGDAGYRTFFDSGNNCIRFVDNASGTFVSDGAGGLKSFVIDHPLDPDRWLVHGCTEGPSAGIEYHGVADVVDHAAVVELPTYFEAAARLDGRQVQLTVVVDDQPADTPAVEHVPPALGPAGPDRAGAVDDGVIGAPVIPEWAQLPVVAASSPRDGRFRITSSRPACRVAWRVFAVRADVDELDVEPLRSTVHARGDGPYRYLTPRRPLL